MKIVIPAMIIRLAGFLIPVAIAYSGEVPWKPNAPTNLAGWNQCHFLIAPVNADGTLAPDVVAGGTPEDDVMVMRLEPKQLPRTKHGLTIATVQ